MTEDTIAIVKALERLSDEVRGVRLAIESFGVAGETVPATERCTHPEDQRVNFSSMGGPLEFHCRACDTRVAPAH